jgi:uncharacterized protein (TIGR01777 family)
MHILIAGGTGQIGRPFCEALLAAGHAVTLLSRSPGRAAPPAGANLAAWDGQTAQGWGALAAEVDAVVNLAGENISARQWSPAQKQAILNSRVQAGKALTAALQAAPRRPRVLLQASAIGYYGSTGDLRLDENSPADAGFFGQICSAWEDSTLAVEAMGVRRAVIRTGLVLTRTGGILSRVRLPVQLFAGGPLGSGRQWMSWIHIQDQVRAMVALLEDPRASGVYNLTAPEPLTNADFTRTLARVLHRPYWLPAPAFALRLLLGEMSSLVLEGQRVLPARLVASGFSYQFSALEPALRNLL